MEDKRLKWTAEDIETLLPAYTGVRLEPGQAEDVAHLLNRTRPIAARRLLRHLAERGTLVAPSLGRAFLVATGTQVSSSVRSRTVEALAGDGFVRFQRLLGSTVELEAVRMDEAD